MPGFHRGNRQQASYTADSIRFDPFPLSIQKDRPAQPLLPSGKNILFHTQRVSSPNALRWVPVSSTLLMQAPFCPYRGKPSLSQRQPVSRPTGGPTDGPRPWRQTPCPDESHLSRRTRCDFRDLFVGRNLLERRCSASNRKIHKIRLIE